MRTVAARRPKALQEREVRACSTVFAVLADGTTVDLGGSIQISGRSSSSSRSRPFRPLLRFYLGDTLALSFWIALCLAFLWKRTDTSCSWSTITEPWRMSVSNTYLFYWPGWRRSWSRGLHERRREYRTRSSDGQHTRESCVLRRSYPPGVCSQGYHISLRRVWLVGRSWPGKLRHRRVFVRRVSLEGESIVKGKAEEAHSWLGRDR